MESIESLAKEYLTLVLFKYKTLYTIILSDGQIIQGNYEILKHLESVFNHKFKINLLYDLQV